MMGSALIAFLGGLHYWWPKIFGKMYNDKVGVYLATVVFFSFNLTFLPQFVMGGRGMHRRYFDYDPQFTFQHQVSSIGAFIMGFALFFMIVNLMMSLRKNGKKAPRNPWGGTTLEWQAPSPPMLYNFPEGEPPVLHEIYDYDDLVYVSPEEGWVRKSEQDGAKAEAKTAAAEGDHE
jgi:cytochrome c oxidase subunit 1